MTKYFTSDTHFAHPFVAALRGYAKTGFTSDNTIKQQANEAHMQVKDCVNWYQHDMDVTGHINEMVGGGRRTLHSGRPMQRRRVESSTGAYACQKLALSSQ